MWDRNEQCGSAGLIEDDMDDWLGWTVAVLGSIVFFAWVIRLQRRWDQPLSPGPDDLRRADDGLRTDREQPSVHGGRATRIPVNIWPPDDRPRRR